MSTAAADAFHAPSAAAQTPPLDGLARLVPAARAGESARLVLRRRSARPSRGAASPTALVLARAGARADGLQQRLTGWWSELAPDEPLVVREGCDVVVAGRRCDGPARLALLVWLPPGRRELLSLEAGLLADAPAVAVGLLLRPPTIWSASDASALGCHSGGRVLDVGQLERLERRARALVGPRQLLRLEAALLRLEAQLPFPGLPGASATVAGGCRTLRADRDEAVAAVALQLVRLAWVAELP